jgi:hypothetical protein
MTYANPNIPNEETRIRFEKFLKGGPGSGPRPGQGKGDSADGGNTAHDIASKLHENYDAQIALENHKTKENELQKIHDETHAALAPYLDKSSKFGVKPEGAGQAVKYLNASRDLENHQSKGKDVQDRADKARAALAPHQEKINAIARARGL